MSDSRQYTAKKPLPSPDQIIVATHVRSLILKHTFADPTDRTKSMTISTAQPPISFIVSLVLSATNSTLESQAVNDRFREHLLDVKNKGSDLSKPVARHFNLPDHSHDHMETCGIYLHLGNNETRKRKEQRLIFKLGTLAPNGINERFSFA